MCGRPRKPPAISEIREGHIPSGKLLHNYGKSPFLMGKLTIKMAIFNSYFDITRGFLVTPCDPQKDRDIKKKTCEKVDVSHTKPSPWISWRSSQTFRAKWFYFTSKSPV